MSIKLVVSDTVLVPVAGTLRDEEGRAVPFNFKLTCRRLSTTALRTQLEAVTDGSLTGDALMQSVVTGWQGVVDEDGKEVGFSPAAFEQMCEIPGISGVAFAAFVQANGAEGKAKN